MTSIKIPKTVTTIEKAFLGNKSLKKVYIPASVTNIDADNFIKSAWEAAPANIVVLYTGNNASTLLTCTGLASATVISANEYDEEKAYTGVNLVVGYSNCVAYNGGIHGSVAPNVIVTTYLDDIVLASNCTVCGMTLEDSKIPALFTCLGTSVSETGTCGIVVGFKVNSESIAAYTQVTGKAVSYGVFAVAQEMLGENEVFDKDGNNAEYAIVAEITTTHKAFEIKVIGIPEAQKDAKLALGAYVKTTDSEKVEYSYMQDTAKGTQTGNYWFVSYNIAQN